MADEMNVTSPAAAFARQAAMEARVESALRWALRLFLADVETMANRDGTYLSPASVGDSWEERMGVEALATRLPRRVAEYVAEVQALADTPVQAYDTAMSVLVASNERAWSAQVTSDVLALALSADTPRVSLTAAAPSRDSRRGKAAREAFDSALRSEGSRSWYDVAALDARTAVTGLDGLLVQEYARIDGYRQKRWVALHDNRTRATHVAADGQTVGIEDTFTVGGASMMHPGDRAAPPAETINCRCVMVAVDGPTSASSKSEAERLADEVYEVSRENEPAITEEMKSLAKATGQRLEGLEYRLKEPGSLSRKIASDARTDGITLEQAAANVSDGVRYTMITSEANYARGARQTLDALRANGWSARVKNAWAQKDRAYQGVNVALTSPSGQAVELQFHTQKSFDAKMDDRMHGTYEKQRVLSRTDPQWQVYETAMHDFMSLVPVPRGATTIG